MRINNLKNNWKIKIWVNKRDKRLKIKLFTTNKKLVMQIDINKLNKLKNN